MNQSKHRIGLGGPLRGSVIAVALTALLGGCFEPSAEQYVKAGKDRLEKNDARAAAIEFKNAVQKNPDMAEARFLLASALLRMGDAVGASVELEKAEKLGYESDRVVPLMAKALTQQGKNEAVVAKYRDVSLTAPAAKSELQVALARVYLLQSKLDEAKAASKKALEAAPDSLEAQQMQLRIQAFTGELPAAVQQARSLVEKHPKDASAWLMLGDFQLLGNDAKQARQSYEESIKLNPGDIQAYYNLMPVLIFSKELKAAASTLAAMEKVDAKNPLTLYFKAWLKMEEGDLKTAQEVAQGLLKQAPDNADVLYLCGSIEARKNSLDRAIDYLGKAVSGAPAKLRPRALLAQTQLRRGDVTKSLATLQPLLKLDTPPADVLVLAATATGRAGDADKAEKLLLRAVAVEPNNVQARVGLAVAKLDKGEQEKGLRALGEIAASTQDISPDLLLIEALIRSKRYDDALAAIKLLQAKPEGKLLAEMQRGKLETERNNIKQAREAYDAALKLDDASVPATVALASLDLAEKRPDSAQARFEKLLQKDPANAAARGALLKMAVDRGSRTEELISMAQQAVKAAPNSRELRVDLARLLLAKPDAKQAAEAAQEAINLLGEDPELMALLGQAQLASGDNNLAINNFTKLSAMRPNLPQPYLLLAGAYKKVGDSTQAIQTLKRGIEVAPDYLLLYQTLTSMQSTQGQFAQALQTARQWQARDKNGWAGYLLEGDVQMRQEKLDAAAEAYRVGTTKNPAPVLAMRLHQVLKRAGKADAAKAFEAKRMADYPNDLNFVNYLAEAAMQEGQFDAAESKFRRALALDPENAAVLNNLAWVLSKKNNAAAALEFATRAVKAAPKRPEFMDTLAEIQAANGQLDQAIEVQRRVMELTPDNSTHRLHLATYLVKAGKKAEAKQELTRLEQLGSSFGRQAEVQRMLASL